MTNFGQGQTNVVFQRTSVWNVGVNAFFEGQFACAAHIVTLPVASSCRTFAPVLFYVVAVDFDFSGWGFIEASEVTTQHDEVRTHSQSQSHVVVLNDTAVRADWNVDTGFFEVFVTSSSNFNYGSSLAAADTFLFAGDADRTAADTDFDEVSACFSQEAEAFCVNNVAGTNFYGVAVVFADPFDGQALPFGEAFGRVDAQYVSACFNQSRNAFCVVTGVDTCAYYIAFVSIQQFQFIFFVRMVVFTEYQIFQILIFVNQRQGVQFVFPDDVVCFFQGSGVSSPDQVFEFGHEFGNFGVHGHTAYAVVTGGNQTQQFTVGRAIFGNSHGGVTGFLFESQNFSQGGVRSDVGVAGYEACFIVFNASNHSSFIFDGLRAVDEGDAAFFRQSDSHFIVRNGLHDCRNQRNVHSDWAFFLAFSVFYQRGLQANVSRDMLGRRISRYQQVFAKGMGRFIEIISHGNLSSNKILQKYMFDIITQQKLTSQSTK